MIPNSMKQASHTLMVELHKPDCQLSLVKNLIDQIMLGYLIVEDELIDYEYGWEPEQIPHDAADWEPRSKPVIA